MKLIRSLYALSAILFAIPIAHALPSMLPLSLANTTIFATITNGNGNPENIGFSLIIADNSGSAYARFGTDPASIGTYTYAPFGQTASLTQIDNAQGRITNSLTFTGSYFGTFESTNMTTISNSGTFVLADGQAPVSISSLTFNFTVLNGQSPMDSNGTFSLTTDLTDTSFSLSGNSSDYLDIEFLSGTFISGQSSQGSFSHSVGILSGPIQPDSASRIAARDVPSINPSGNYLYALLNKSTARLVAVDTNPVSPTYLNTTTIYLGYTHSGLGTFALQSVNGGFQTGSFTVTTNSAAPFFDGANALGSATYFLQFTNSAIFGYYNMSSFPYVYHFDMGWFYFIDADETNSGNAYFYDFTTGHFWYTGTGYFPYVYDFSLNSWLYYYPNPTNVQSYSKNPRFFYNFATTHTFNQ